MAHLSIFGCNTLNEYLEHEQYTHHQVSEKSDY
jgi:hypothetical protein